MSRFTLISYFACLLMVSVSNAQSITEYRYWWDDDLSTLTTENVSAGQTFNLETELSTAQLSNGHHFLTVQVKDDSDAWSVPYTHILFQNGNLVQYEYWFDDDISESTVQATSQTNLQEVNASIDVSALSPGIHKITIRSLANNGESSVPQTRYFKIGGGDLVNWEYWFDDDPNNSFQESITPPQNTLELIDNLNTSGLSTGAHTVTWRCEDAMSNWSVPITHGFDVVLGVVDIAGLQSVLLYPSPTRDQLSIKVEMDTPIALNVEILNQNGQLINFNQNGLSSANSLKTLDVSNLAAGVYFLRLSNSQGFTTHKFVKQ
ncbi:MAG: T9SS type A sorting domain-containing protein [Cryomorphaceae bacterium]|nr:T9SS type A sorting domain-containing protein [Flavobacteriales bacterium]